MPRRLDWAVEGRDWPNHQFSRFVDVEGLRWHVQTMGTGPGLLLLHGTGASTHSFRDLMPLLAQRFSVTCPDLPGHGFSEPAPGFVPSLEGMAAALAGLLEVLKVTPTIAVGHSAGAAVVTRMTLNGHLTPLLLVGLGAAMVPFRGPAGVVFLPAARLLAGSRLASRLVARRARDPGTLERLVNSTGSVLDERGVELYGRLASNPAHVASVLDMMANWDLQRVFTDLSRLSVPGNSRPGPRTRASWSSTAPGTCCTKRSPRRSRG